MPSISSTALGVGAGHDLRAVGLVAQAVEEPLARWADALDHDLGRLVDEDAHVRSSPWVIRVQALASATARRAASSMVGSAIRVSDRWSASSARPASALVPSRRITTGEFRLTRPIAS